MKENINGIVWGESKKKARELSLQVYHVSKPHQGLSGCQRMGAQR